MLPSVTTVAIAPDYPPMIMMLPFLTGLLAAFCGVRGQRRLCISLWLLTVLIFAAWCDFHMTDPLGLSL